MTKSYIYSPAGQIICQRDGGQAADEYFYITDRLGSVRQVVDNAGSVVLNHTYTPFGQTLVQNKKDGFDYSFNPFLFTGQWLDSEINQYYLRARMYDPALGRFTTRDPVKGKYKNPLTLHPYLYCQNNTINRTDPSGEFSIIGLFMSAIVSSDIRGTKNKADMMLFGSAKNAAAMINEMQTARAVAMDVFYESFVYGETKSIALKAALSSLGVVSDSLGQLAGAILSAWDIYQDPSSENIFENLLENAKD